MADLMADLMADRMADPADWILSARQQWHWRGQARPPFAAPPGGGELRWAGATALGALPPALSGTLGATSSHLEAHYEALVAPIRVKTAEKHARGTRWAYGSI